MGGPKGNNHNPDGRPKKEIDWNLFEQLCEIQCTQSEIASMMKIHPETLCNRAKEHYQDDYSNIYKKFAESGKCSLRRSQFVLSKTNAALAIWLGKQWLGQREPETNHLNESEQLRQSIEKQEAILNQLKGLQSARKIDDNNNKADAKS